MRKIILVCGVLAVGGCATLTEDPMVPVALSFSDGASGECTTENKRGRWPTPVPAVVSVRRSDDPLKYDCQSENGGKAAGSIPSTMGAKIIASAVFIDLGITDAITDMHREYPPSYVIPIKSPNDRAEGAPKQAELYRAQALEVAEAMMCTKQATMVETMTESEKWELDCGDGEKLSLRCFEDTCYVKSP